MQPEVLICHQALIIAEGVGWKIYRVLWKFSFVPIHIETVMNWVLINYSSLFTRAIIAMYLSYGQGYGTQYLNYRKMDNQ